MSAKHELKRLMAEIRRAVMSEFRRIGCFTVEEAQTIDDFICLFRPQGSLIRSEHSCIYSSWTAT